MRTINKEELINDIKEIETNIEFINTHCESRYYGEPKAKVLKGYRMKLYHLRKQLDKLNEEVIIDAENKNQEVEIIEAIETPLIVDEAPNNTTKKKIALLIPAYNTITDKWFYVWQSLSEKDLSKEYDSRQEALNNRPQGYIYKDDGWNNISFN